MYTLYNNMYNIQFVQYIMVLYNVSEIRYTDVVSINKQLQQIKQFKKIQLEVLYKRVIPALFSGDPYIFECIFSYIIYFL